MKTILINNCLTYLKGKFVKKNILIQNGILKDISSKKINASKATIIDATDNVAIPGLIDIHVHLREPGYEYKETIKTGTRAAAAGGYTTVCCMPNLIPEIDSVERIQDLIDRIKKDAIINVLPYSSITIGRKPNTKPINFNLIKDYCFAFSNDGCGIATTDIMQQAMIQAKQVNKPIVAHCEDLTLIPRGAYINDGVYAKEHNLVGIPAKSEYKQVERDVKLASKIGCQYHVCHISCKQTLDIIKKASKKNKNITCEVTPHHLLLNETLLKDDGSFKMNPPLRSVNDQKALIKGIQDGSIKIIASDHAPHSKSEKAKGLEKSAFGITALDFAFPLLYTKLVKSRIITFNKLIELMSINPSKIFNIKSNELQIGQPANFTIVDIKHKEKIDPNKFYSKGKSTPFAGLHCYGWPILTICNGKIVYKKSKYAKNS